MVSKFLAMNMLIYKKEIANINKDIKRLKSRSNLLLQWINQWESRLEKRKQNNITITSDEEDYLDGLIEDRLLLITKYTDLIEKKYKLQMKYSQTVFKSDSCSRNIPQYNGNSPYIYSDRPTEVMINQQTGIIDKSINPFIRDGDTVYYIQSTPGKIKIFPMN